MLRVVVWRVSRRGVARVRTQGLPLADIDDTHPVPVYWSPIADSAGQRFMVLIRQVPTVKPGPVPLYFTWRRSGATLIHSSPEPRVSFPGAVLFSPVTQCNLNCIHCISRHSRTSVSTSSEAAWAELAAAAASGRLIHLRSDYSGDLFFSDRRHGGWLDRIIALGIPFSIDTHANDLGIDVVARLMRSHLSFINFSIDSLDSDDYPRIRRGARPLAEVLANVRHFMAQRNTARPDIETVLSFVLMRRNLDSFSAAIDLAAELGVTAVMGSHLHAYTPEMAEESLMLQPARYARAYVELVAKAQTRRVNIGLPPPVRARTSPRGHAACHVPWNTAVVLGNGDVMGCCVPGTKVGNLRESGLEDIWNGEAMRQFRLRVNSDTPPDACSVCPMMRLPHNFASYVPGLAEADRTNFEHRCLEA
jgi:radical SAM protein with 4Fe4S-binding SPASM domain